MATESAVCFYMKYTHTDTDMHIFQHCNIIINE